MPTKELIAHLTDGRTSLAFVGDGGVPELAHWGGALGDEPIDPVLFERPIAGGGLDVDAPVGLVSESARGWFGVPGLAGSRPDGSDFAPRFALATVDASNESLSMELADDTAKLTITMDVSLDSSGVVVFDASLRNEGSTEYVLDALRLGFPVPRQAGEILTVGGRHNFEFAQHRTDWANNSLVVSNRHGKTSHERLGVVFAGTSGFGEADGEVWAVHIGWSGNYEFTCDAVSEGRKSIHVGELLLPGEVRLAPGDVYRAPTIYTAYSPRGLGLVSSSFHDYLRSRSEHPDLPRPVHLNTWEAVYFDHDLERLSALAEAAAAVGVERFVLDDGWFGGRRDDTRGLGDWFVSPEVWPDGLDPLIDHVRQLGMEFGIWVEPEMVSPDSDLYRSHPDWALVDQRYPHVYGRGQLVLDVGRPAVRDHLFEALDSLLANHDISYVKWDHNRDLVSPASGGAAGVRRQTLGVYELLDRLREAHPDVDFETCASGGGRVDFAILERTVRVWPSDSIDALDRLSIQQGFSLLFPPELMASHIGSPEAHSTRRRHRTGFRAATAMFGTLGVEWNLLEASQTDLDELAEMIAIHKRFRSLVHTGSVVRIDHPDPTVDIHGVVAADGAEALFQVTRLASSPTHHTPPVRLRGLDEHATYEVTLIPIADERFGIARRQPGWVESKLVATGRQLAAAGFSMPQMDPESSLLLHLTAGSARSAEQGNP